MDYFDCIGVTPELAAVFRQLGKVEFEVFRAHSVGDPGHGICWKSAHGMGGCAGDGRLRLSYKGGRREVIAPETAEAVLAAVARLLAETAAVAAASRALHKNPR